VRLLWQRTEYQMSMSRGHTFLGVANEQYLLQEIEGNQPSQSSDASK
jgi:hypothetical protein